MAVSALHTKSPTVLTTSTCSRSVKTQRPATHSRTPIQVSPMTARTFTGGNMPRPSMCPKQQRGVACQGLFGLGLPELAVIAGVTALIFGPSKLPELGKGLGKTVKSFQTAAKEFKTELEAAAAEDDQPKAAASNKQHDGDK